MGVRERVLTLRLLEKTAKHSGYAKQLGVEVVISKISGEARRFYDNGRS